MEYAPPFNLNDEMLEIVANIVELLGQISNVDNLSRLPRLRRISRIKSIHSSLAIENNTLTIEQVTGIINGKTVLAPPNEIQEVKNAIDAYNQIDKVGMHNIKDLLNTHGIMMKGLVDNAGSLRTGQAGVFDENGKVIHIAPPPENVPALLSELFSWLKTSKTHPLLKSCVFHYEFEFIHPFPDGNGRMGRFWQTVILSAWKPIFKWIPIESIIKLYQKEYYEAIAHSTIKGNSNPFIIYMLQVIHEAVKSIATQTKEHQNHISEQTARLMDVMPDYPLSSSEIMRLLGLKSKQAFRSNYLLPAIEAGLIAFTEPSVPTSRNQRYIKKY